MEKKLPQKMTKQTKKSKIISAMLFLPLSILCVEHIRQKFNFSEEEMQNVPQNPFTDVYFDQRTPNTGQNLHIC